MKKDAKDLKEEIKEYIHKYYKENGVTPRLSDFRLKYGAPCNKETLCKKIGKYNDILRECGYQTYSYGQRRYNKKELLHTLKLAVIQHRSIDFRFIRKDNELKHRDIYTRVFGNVRAALSEAGILNNHIFLLRTYNDYKLEDPVQFLTSKLNFEWSEEAIDLVCELNVIKSKHGTVSRDAVAKNMSIRKIYRVFYNYNNFMILSGNQVNLKNKNYMLSKDGHMCDSLEECIIDDFLFELNLSHEVHVKYPSSKLVCDFKIDNVFIECIGFSRNSTSKTHDRYMRHLKQKEDICEKRNIKLITILNPNCINKDDLAEALCSNAYRITL